MIFLLVLTFVITVATGPAGQEVRAARRARLESPTAKVMYLPSASCRAPEYGDLTDR